MSISLPNGTLLATPAQQTQYTAAVTRILHLSNFPAELKTRDLQFMFKDHENDKGGFRIKWVDDTNALVVFADAGVAKRAYLTFLLSPPSTFPPPAKIKPYDRPDAAQIIQALSARAMGHRASMSSFNQAPMSGAHGGAVNGAVVEGLPNSHHRGGSLSKGTSGPGGWTFPSARAGSTGAGPGPGGLSSNGSGSSNGTGATANINASGNGNNGAGTGRHGRTGSASSFSLSRQPLAGLGGALNFASSNPPSTLSSRLPTHAESLDSPAMPSGFSTNKMEGVGGGASRRLTGRPGIGSLSGGGASGGVMGAFGGRTGAGALSNVPESTGSLTGGDERPPRPLSATSARSGMSTSARSGDSSDNEPLVIMDHAPTPEPGTIASASALLGGTPNDATSSATGGRGRVPFGQWKMPSASSRGSTTPSPRPNSSNSNSNPNSNSGSAGAAGSASRRDSVSADKALREVQRALATVEGSSA